MVACGRSRNWFRPRFRESPGDCTSAGTFLVGIAPVWGSWRSRVCCFPGSMCRSRRCTPPLSGSLSRRQPAVGRRCAQAAALRDVSRASRYRRRLAERPVAGRPLMISLRIRRFFCDRSRCWRRTFAEQIPELIERYRRHSIGLRQWMQAVVTFLGGRPGQRLCKILQFLTGRTHLLGLLTAQAVPRAGTSGARRRRIRLPK